MNWICPNCSYSNDETQTECMVCGMDKPAAVAKPESGDLKIVFSDSQAFAESVRKLFRPKPSVDAYSDDEDSDPEESSMFSKPVHEKKKKVKPD